MAIGDLAVITVTGKYRMFDNSVAVGGVIFTPDPRLESLRDPGSSLIVIPKVIAATLDNTGAFSLQLPASNDPDVFPTGFTYTVTENIQQTSGLPVPNTYPILIPFDAIGGTIDLSQITITAPLPDISGYALVSDLAALAGRVSTLEAGAGSGGDIDGGGA